MDAVLQYILLPVNSIAAFFAALVVLRVMLRGGSRILVNLYAFLICLYVGIIFLLATLEIISRDTLSGYAYWAWTAAMVYIALSYLTERRGSGGWIKRG